MRATLVKSELFENGFARYDLADRLGVSDTDTNFTALLAEFRNLPHDPYAPGTRRYRRYARGLYLPWSREFSWIPATQDQDRRGVNGYFQGDHNPDFVNIVRQLPAMTESARNNPLLLDLLHFDFEQTRWDENDSVWPLHVGVHLIKLSVDDEGEEAISSPNEFHQDGEPFVFVHLVYRKNAEGGRNIIASPRFRGKQPADVSPEDRFADFEMIRPLESYAIRDVSVSHYVGPIRKAPGAGPGERAVVLVDYVPMRQQLI